MDKKVKIGSTKYKNLHINVNISTTNHYVFGSQVYLA